MNEVVFNIISLLLGFSVGILAVGQSDVDLKSFKRTAVEYGYATYTVDVNGTSSFTWIIPAEKK